MRERERERERERVVALIHLSATFPLPLIMVRRQAWSPSIPSQTRCILYESGREGRCREREVLGRREGGTRREEGKQGGRERETWEEIRREKEGGGVGYPTLNRLMSLVCVCLRVCVRECARARMCHSVCACVCAGAALPNAQRAGGHHRERPPLGPRGLTPHYHHRAPIPIHQALLSLVILLTNRPTCLAAVCLHPLV